MNVEKTNIKLLIIIALIVTTVLSATYAFLNLQGSATTEETKAGCFTVSYEGQIINESNITSIIEPSEDADAKTKADFESKVAHATVTLKKDTAQECEIYTEATISLYTGTITAPLNNPRALKYKVLEGTTEQTRGVITNTTIEDPSKETNPIPTDFSTDLLTVDLETTAKTYDIYIWIDRNLSNGYYNEKTYSGYIYATAEQTSTIK